MHTRARRRGVAASGLVDAHPAELISPAMVSVIRDSGLLAELADGYALGLENFGLAEKMDDLLGVELLKNSNIQVVSVFPGQVTESPFQHSATRAPYHRTHRPASVAEATVGGNLQSHARP